MDRPAAADTRALASSGSEAALILAAVDRMQRAELHARLSLIRLRTGLGDMALAIGRTKARAASTDEETRQIDTAALLDEFEHRVDAMLEIAGGSIAPKSAAPQPAPPSREPAQAAGEATAAQVPMAATPATDAEQVPTISGVVSGRESEATAETAPGPHDAALAAAAAGPTVEMLRSLVAALNASIPAEPVAPGEPSAEFPAAAESIAEVAPEIALEPAAPDSAAAIAEALAAEPVQEMASAVVQDAEPLVFDVVVEFDKPEPEVQPDDIAVEAPAAPQEQHNARESVAAIDAREIAAASEAQAPTTDTVATVEPIAAPEPEPQIAQILTVPPEEPVSIAEPMAEEAAPEASGALTGPTAELTLVDNILADLPSMPYEASPDDVVAPEAIADTPLIQPDLTVEPAAQPQDSSQDSSQASPPASSVVSSQLSSQLSPEVPTQASLPQDAVIIHEVELLARFEQMEAMPLLPPEIGTAVIFNPRSTPIAEVAEGPEPSAPNAPATDEAVSAEAATPETAIIEPVAADIVVSEAAAPEATSPDPAVPEPAAELAAMILPPPAEAAPAETQAPANAEPSVQPEPDAAAEEDWTVEFKLPGAVLPPVDLDSAPFTESAMSQAAAVSAAGPVMPAAELSAIEAVIAEAFSDRGPAAEPAAPSATELPPRPAETASEPAQNFAQPPLQDAAPEVVQAAAACESVPAPVPETESEPEPEAELPPVDLDAEFDADDFLFGEGAAEMAAGPAAQAAPIAGLAATSPAADAEAAAAGTGLETRPDPLIPIKAMTPEERIALFS